jgi:hypothetical protein
MSVRADAIGSRGKAHGQHSGLVDEPLHAAIELRQAWRVDDGGMNLLTGEEVVYRGRLRIQPIDELIAPVKGGRIVGSRRPYLEDALNAGRGLASRGRACGRRLQWALSRLLDDVRQFMRRQGIDPGRLPAAIENIFVVSKGLSIQTAA